MLLFLTIQTVMHSFALVYSYMVNYERAVMNRSTVLFKFKYMYD